jgi:hypothetical protein
MLATTSDISTISTISTIVLPMTLHRTGSFVVNDTAEDHAQCGFRRGDRQVWYDVSIESDSSMLDSDGFVLDNNAVQHYFDDTYATVTEFQSCERIAIRAILDLCRLMGPQRCHMISVEIKPGDYAGIKATQRFSWVEGAE